MSDPLGPSTTTIPSIPTSSAPTTPTSTPIATLTAWLYTQGVRVVFAGTCKSNNSEKCCQIVYRESAVRFRYLGQEFKADSMNSSNRFLKSSNLTNQRPELLESYIRIFDSFDSSFIRKIRKIQLQLPALEKPDMPNLLRTHGILRAVMSAIANPCYERRRKANQQSWEALLLYACTCNSKMAFSSYQPFLGFERSMGF